VAVAVAVDGGKGGGGCDHGRDGGVVEEGGGEGGHEGGRKGGREGSGGGVLIFD
jgi:hypothetical protein